MRTARTAVLAALGALAWLTGAAGCEDASPAPSPDAATDVVAEVGDTLDAVADVPDDDGGPDADAPDTTAETDGDAAADADADAEAEVEAGPPPFPEAPAWFTQIQLADLPLDDEGESDPLEIDLPDGTVSVFVMAETPLDYGFLQLKTVVTPKPLSQIIVKGAGDATCIPCLNRVSAGQKLASFLLPNDPDLEVRGGEWLLRLRQTGILKTAFSTTYPPQAGSATMTLLARTEPVPDEGVLRLHLHFTGSGGLTAETAPDDPALQAGLATMTSIYAGAGITVEVVGYHDVAGVDADPTLVDLESTIGNPNDLSKLLLTGQGDDTLALNVFFVNSIYRDGDFAGGGTVLGIAGGVPGPAFVVPSYRSGVVIATEGLGGRVDYFGNVLAHEVGHYLGLYHSTEKDGVIHDTLADTGEEDATNLMYWAYSPEQEQVTPSQAWVMRSHPLVLPVPPSP